MCPGCARTFAHKTFFDNHVSLCVTGNESEPEEEPEDEPPEDEPEEQPEEQPEDEPRIVPFYDQSDRSSLAVPSHEALGSISPSLQAEVAAVEKFVTEHCAEIIAGITHGEAPMYEPVRAHAEALRNLERTSCLLVVSTVPAVYNCFIAIELPAHLGGWRRPVRFGLWSQWLTWLGGICSVEESDSAGVAAHKRGWGIGGTVGGHGRGRGGALGPSLQARPPRRLASAGSIRLVVTVADLARGHLFGGGVGLSRRGGAQAWLGYRWHGGRPRPRPWGGAWPQFTGPPTSAVGVGRFDSACGHSG